MSDIETGIYQHYKGQDYEVLGQVRHSETEELMVVYRALYGDYGLWVRPKAMFTENIIIDGCTQPRFKLIESYVSDLGRFSNKAKN
jgi:hypothetical protein